MKKNKAFLLVLIFICNCFINVNAFEFQDNPYLAKFFPPDNYRTMQNPPDFRWQIQENALSYDLIVCSDYNLNNIKYEKRNIRTWFYNFPEKFLPGTYYWSLRYKTNNGYSMWTTPEKFYIDKDAYSFPVPEVSEMLGKIPLTHPRILFDREDIEKIRQDRKNGTSSEAMIRETGRSSYQNQIKLPDDYLGMAMNVMYSSLYYILTGNGGENARAKLNTLASLDPGGSSSFFNNDQKGRAIMQSLAYSYDWLYDILSAEEKAKILDNIETRIKQVCDGNSPHGIKDVLKGKVYNSHGWTALGMTLESLIAVYDKDNIYIKEKTSELLPLFINNYVPWSSEDGGWSQGAYYWWSAPDNNEAATVLRNIGIIDLTKKAWKNNELFFDIYFWPRGTLSLFGDDDNKEVGDYNKCAFAVDNPIFYPHSSLAKWYRNQYKDLVTDKNAFNYGVYFYQRYKDRFYEDNEITSPSFMEKGKVMKDIGWCASHSDLTDKDKISLYFKSSPYGSYSHSHGDQNSFVIDAFGKRLAFDSGYYDSWGSPFDREYSRKTYAHNSITHSNGKGQSTMDITAKGEVTGFLTHPDFDLHQGNATTAYKGDIDNFERNIIYLRPDEFLIIDDLKAKDNTKTNFELWLNAEDKITLFKDRKGARIEKDGSVLDAEIKYPEIIRANYNDTFSGTDYIGLTPSGNYKDKPVHKRVWFQTKKKNSTKIVTVMNVHKKGENSKNVRSEYINNCLKLSFENGTNAYININNLPEVNILGYKFKGLALIEKGNSLMLIKGNYIENSRHIIFSSDNDISITLGKERFGISNKNAKTNIKISCGKIDRVREIKDDKEREILINKEDNTGIYWNKEKDNLTNFIAEPGFYTLYFNNRERNK